MEISEHRDSGCTPVRKRLTLDRSDLPLTVRYGDITYVLVVTKTEKLLLQKPLE